MNIKPIDQEENLEPLDGNKEEVVSPLTKGGVEDRVEELSVQTEHDSEYLKDKVLNDSEFNNTPTGNTADPNIAIDEAVSKAYSEDEVQKRFEDINASNGQLRVSNEDLIEQNLLAEGAFGSAQTQYYSNINFAENYITEVLRKNAEDKTFTGKAFDFVDRFLIRQIPIGAFEDVMKKNTSKSEELLQAAVTLPLAEYKVFIKNYVEEMAAEGIFREDNLFALAQAYENARSAGYNPEENADALMGAIDLGTLGFGAVTKLGKLTKLKKLSKVRSPLEKIAAVKGTDQAGDVAGAVAVKNPQGVNQLNDTVPSAASYNPSAVRPSNSRTRAIIEENTIIEEVKRVSDSNALGRVVTSDEIAIIASKAATRIADVVDRPVRDFNIVTSDVIDQNVLEVKLGKPKTGDVYKLKSSAQKVADTIPNSTVSELDDGWEIVVRERLEVNDVFDELDLNPVFPVGAEQIHKIVGSSANRDTTKLDALSKMGESASLALFRAAEPAIKTYTKLSARQQYGVNAVLRDLRDGPDSATKQYYTDLEFAAKYTEKTGKVADEKIIDGYHAALEVSDAAWLIDANNMLSRYTNQGYTKVVVNDHISLPAKQVEKGNIPLDAKIYNADSDKFVDLSAVSPKSVVWIGDRPLPDGSKYFVRPLEVKMLEPEDVLGYNAGGRRTYEQANYYVTLGDDVVEGVAKREKAIMHTATQKQATKAQEEINTISEAKRRGDLTDEVVAANNAWNPAIETVSELNKFLEDKGLNLNRAVQQRAKDTRVTNIDENSPLFNESYGEYIKHDMTRGNEVLMSYGGKSIVNDDPLSAITQQFASAANNLAMKAYSYRATQSWIEAAKKLGGEVELGKSPNPLIQMSEAVIKGTSPASSRLRELRAITMRRQGIDGEKTKAFKSFVNAITEELPFVKRQVNVTKAERDLLNIGFQSNFGFFALDQFFMQSFHAVAISAMHPVHGAKSALEVIPLRGLLNTKTSDGYNLAVTRFAKLFGYKEDEVREMGEYFYTSGRDIVAGDAIEQGTGIGQGYLGRQAGNSSAANVADKTLKAAKKGLDLGLTPFNQGERLSRSTSVLTAIKMYKAEFPNKSILTDEARQWIAKKDGALSLNMTTQGRAFAQSGPMKIPTQWLSFSFRAMEAMAFGKDLTKGERARLFAVLVPMFGLTGFGAERFADEISENLGLTPDSPAIKSIRYGLLDTMIGLTTGLDTAVASRLAPLTIVTDLNQKLTEDGVVETIAGPSGGIAGDILEAGANAISSFKNGYQGQLTQDVLRILRQPSGVDDLFKAYGIFNRGTLRSKNGVEFEGSLSASDGVVQLLGFTPAKVIEIRERRNQLYLDSKNFTKLRREIDKQAEVAFSLMESEDEDEVRRGIKIFEEVGIKIEFSATSPPQRKKLRAALRKNEKLLINMTKNYNEQHKFWAADRTETLLGE